MRLTSVIAGLLGELVAHGDVEVKLDIDGLDVDPDFEWNERKGLVYLW